MVLISTVSTFFSTCSREATACTCPSTLASPYACVEAKPHLQYLVFDKCRTRRRHRPAATSTQSTRKCGQTAACGRRAAHKWMQGAPGLAFALDAQRRARTAHNLPSRAIQAGSEERRSITAARGDGTCKTTTPRHHDAMGNVKAEGDAEQRRPKVAPKGTKHQVSSAPPLPAAPSVHLRRPPPHPPPPQHHARRHVATTSSAVAPQRATVNIAPRRHACASTRLSLCVRYRGAHRVGDT